MALQKTVTFSGVSVTDAYHKISRVKIDKLTGINVKVDSFVDKSTSDALGAPFMEESYNLDYSDSLGTLASLYTHLKNNVAEYSGATDV